MIIRRSWPHAIPRRYWLLHCPERHILLQALEETQCLACIVHRLETSHGGVRTQGDAIQLTQDLFILCQVMHYIDLAKNDVVFHWCLEVCLAHGNGPHDIHSLNDNRYFSIVTTRTQRWPRSLFFTPYVP